MRRSVLVLAVLAVVGTGLVAPVPAHADGVPGITGGTVTIDVSVDAYGFPNWSSTFSGQFAVGGRTYSGTATGTDQEADPYGVDLNFSGTSTTGTISSSCFGNFANPTGIGPTLALGGPAGVLEE
ncbi:MAG: hypothetical protein JWP02_3993, partial [Acidimicrobiales bacterium]|nr:hypothetical protein [Acidimicrobiales bacterium]